VSAPSIPAPESTGCKLSVVVPAYNEAARIGRSLEEIVRYLSSAGHSYEVLVVDDGSQDATCAVVEEIVSRSPEVRLLRYDQNRGKGYAVRHGVLKASGEHVLFSDADLATPIEEVEALMSALNGGADVAIGSRDIPGAKLERRQSPLREFGGKVFNRCVQTIALPGIHDTQCGFKLFPQDVARNVFSRCQIDNFSFDVEVLFLCRRLGYRVKEVPVRWTHQEGSKVRFVRDAIRMLATLLSIRASACGLTRCRGHETSLSKTPVIR
jgi:dolichyl-phosphate beta-glucosyltransferase